ncbi:MAG TPA: hypothetical protein VHO28_12305 [Ignavibacteriales bacterium]|nr:hypothetical protein [Ignavibacteriales bacterium]
MEQNILHERIASLVDNEIKDQKAKKELLQLIESDQDLQFEYEAQSAVKRLIKDKVPRVKAPQALRSEIITMLRKENYLLREEKKKFDIKNILQFIFQPRVAYPALAAVFLLGFYFFFLPIQSIDISAIAREQSGPQNMYAQAMGNFQSILDGRLPVQFSSSDPAEVKKFFARHGVDYPTYVPNLPDWKLLGAVVSEEGGRKMAHHVYGDGHGKYIYVYQADQKHCGKNKTLSLSADLLNLINGGRLFTFENKDKATIVWKRDNKIFIAVSNDDLQKVKNNLTAAN